MTRSALWASGSDLAPDVRDALAELLLAVADDEFVIGFMESEWTGIAPLLEEDVAMSSLAQDELGHARALYELLGGLTDREADAIAYDRSPSDFRHARLLDHPRGDWATTVARRYLYDTADAARLDALVGSSWPPLAELVAKIRREERYHLMHADAWLERLATSEGEPRQRLLAAFELLAPDAGSVLSPLTGESTLLEARITTASAATQQAAWRSTIEPRLAELDLPRPRQPAGANVPGDARAGHSDAFAWLHEQLTGVRRIDPEATW
jgi:ring-1,2-phenylacetyl-CoA epoxidase subunit PaaC